MSGLPEDAAEVITLWPDGPPTPIADVPPEVADEVRAGVAAGTTFLRNISDPTLTAGRSPLIRAHEERSVIAAPSPPCETALVATASE
jgi:hypothetical protein